MAVYYRIGYANYIWHVPIDTVSRGDNVIFVKYRATAEVKATASLKRYLCSDKWEGYV